MGRRGRRKQARVPVPYTLWWCRHMIANGVNYVQGQSGDWCSLPVPVSTAVPSHEPVCGLHAARFAGQPIARSLSGSAVLQSSAPNQQLVTRRGLHYYQPVPTKPQLGVLLAQAS